MQNVKTLRGLKTGDLGTRVLSSLFCSPADTAEFLSLKKKKLEEKNRKKRTRGLTCDTVLLQQQKRRLEKGRNKEAVEGNERKTLRLIGGGGKD